MKLTDKQKKIIWIAAMALAAIYFAPRMTFAVRQAIVAHAQHAALTPPTAATKTAAPAAAASQPPMAAAAPDVPPDDPRFLRLVGNWLGGGLLPDRGFCRLALELRRSKDKPGYYTGYSTLTCGPLLPSHRKSAQQNSADNFINQMSPVSTILTGSVVDGSIRFHVDHAIGAAPDGCQVTGFTVTPFGDDQIAAIWQSGTCPERNMILQRMAG